MASPMKRWEMNTFGRENLRLVTTSSAPPADNEVVVKVSAVSLNARDKQTIEDGLGLSLTFPFTPAADMAGVVVAAGAKVTRWRPCDRVVSLYAPEWRDGLPGGTARAPFYRPLGGVHPGVLSEYVTFPEDWFVAAPASLSDAEASTLSTAGLTAWFALVERCNVKAGQTVLVHGTGGVALFGIQIAKAHGAMVIVTSGSDDKLARAKPLGADHGINRVREDWVEAVYRLTGDRGADHILEIIGGANLRRSLEAAAVGGHIAVIGLQEGWDISASSAPLLLKRLTIDGFSVGHRRAMEDFVRAIDRIGLKPVIDKAYSFEKLHDALDHLERGPFGKIVIQVAA